MVSKLVLECNRLPFFICNLVRVPMTTADLGTTMKKLLISIYFRYLLHKQLSQSKNLKRIVTEIFYVFKLIIKGLFGSDCYFIIYSFM